MRGREDPPQLGNSRLSTCLTCAPVPPVRLPTCEPAPPVSLPHLAEPTLLFSDPVHTL